MKADLTIYLAGAMCGISHEEQKRWRKKLKTALENCSYMCEKRINIISPVDYYNFEEKLQQSEREVMQFDLNMVKKSDIVIVNTDKLNTSIGSSIELYEAFKSDIPVIAYNFVSDCTYIHPWLKCCITRTEKSIDDICNYIMNFYLT